MEKFTVIGLGYVGLSLATLIAQSYEVIAYDIDEDKISKLKEFKSPISDDYIEDYLSNKKLNLIPTNDLDVAFKDRDCYIIATPTDYNEETDTFDVSSLEFVISQINQMDPKSTVVIKSTIPVFYTNKLIEEYPNLTIIFSPEFLREGKALYDNLYPSRIIVSPKIKEAELFGNILKEHSLKEDTQLILMGTTEAEAVKLFSNTYLALRVSFFNELDTFSEHHNLNTKDIINGVSLDSRVGDYYNNPSFGFGGYCLPKDTKQLKANFKDLPNSVISSVIESNELRKQFIAKQILKRKPKTVGIYKLAMKAGSDNFRSSSIIDVMNLISDNSVEVLLYDENLMGVEVYEGFQVEHDKKEFLDKSDVIVTNRFDDTLFDYAQKVYTRDIFGNN